MPTPANQPASEPLFKVELPFPINGIDRSDPLCRQRPFTCPDARNVVGYPPLSGRRGGGRRDGFLRAFDNAAGSADAGPVGLRASGCTIAVRSYNQQVNTAGNFVELRTSFGDEYAKPYTYGGTFDTGVDFNGSFILFAKDMSSGGSPWATGLPATGIFPASPFVPANARDPRSLGTELRAQSFPISSSLEYGAALAFPTTNELTMVGHTLPAPFGRQGASLPAIGGECTYIGPMARGADELGGFAVAYLEPVSPDRVRLRIDVVDGDGVNLQSYTSPNVFSLRGQSNVRSAFSIEFKTSANSMRARVLWVSQNIDDTLVVDNNVRMATTITLPVTGAAGLWTNGTLVTGGTSGTVGRLVWTRGAPPTELTLHSVTGTTFTPAEALTAGSGGTATAGTQTARDNNRGGVFFRYRGSLIYRTVVDLQWKQLEPLPAQVVASLSAADVNRDAGIWQGKIGFDYLDVIRPVDGNMTILSCATGAYSFGSDVAVDAKPAFPVLERVGVPMKTGGVAQPAIIGGSSAVAASVAGSRTNKTQLILPSGAAEVEAWTPWALATLYAAGDERTNASGAYRCTTAHTSAATDEPGVGVNWPLYWRELLGHYDVETGFQDTDGLVDDTIGPVFSVYGFSSKYTTSFPA